MEVVGKPVADSNGAAAPVRTVCDLPPAPGTNHDIVVVGASAGGVDAISRLVEELPYEYKGALLVVIHMMPSATSALPAILTRARRRSSPQVSDGDPIEYGRIYVSPPDLHLLVDCGHVRLGRGPREHGHRPAIDPFFRSAAEAYGPRVVGVLMSGMLDDGVAGLAVIKRAGGTALVQDPSEAAFPSMPEAAISAVRTDAVLPVKGLAEEVARLADTPLTASERTYVPRTAAELQEMVHGTSDRSTGSTGSLTCPECGGLLTERVEESRLIRFSCPVGHVYSVESLLAMQSESLESALWASIRRLEEQSRLLQQAAKQLRRRGSLREAGTYEQQAHDCSARVRLLRKVVLAAAVEEVEPVTPTTTGDDESA